MNQVFNLFGVILSPIGMLLAVFGLFAISRARSKRWLPFLVLGILIFAASLSRFVSVWIPDPPPFSGVINNLVSNGRSITILVLFIAIAIPVRYQRDSKALPTFALAFFIAQVVIALKIFSGGSIGFAALSIVTTVLIFYFFSQVSRRWIQSSDDIDAAIISIAFATGFFVAINSLQYILGPGPLAVANNRFNGTTGNPQHAAAFLGVGIPALVYLALTRRWLLRLVAIAVGAIATYFLLWTGSRTGVLMASIATLLLLRRSGAATVSVAASTLTGALFWIATTGNFDSSLRRISSLEDTRTAVWAALWRQFEANPLFGVPISGDRLGFGENSWLAMGASTGIIGLIPLMFGGAILLVIASRLLMSRPSGRSAKLQGDFLGAAIISLMIGSVFEAFLLAVVSSATFMLLLLGVVGARRLALNAAHRSEQPNVTGLSGAIR